MRPVIGIFVALSLFGIVGYLNGYYSVNSINREPNMPPLYDNLYQVIPRIDRKYPDNLLTALIFYFIIRWWFENKIVLEHFFIIMTAIFTIRVLSFTVTQEPPPVKGCDEREPGQPTRSFFRMAKDLFYSRQCSDLMFSGHAAFTVLIALFTIYYSKLSIEKFIISLIAVIELILIIAGRLHYSSDVIIGTAMTVFAFYSWQHIGLPWLK